jgi:aspartyl/asparaginyl beta-hydroxylase
MEIQGNYRELGRLTDDELVRLQQAVEASPESEWDSVTRQRLFAAHKDTSSIILCFGPDDDAEAAEFTPLWSKWQPILGPLLDRILAEHFDDGGKIIRLMIVRLHGHSRVAPHTDDLPVLVQSHRVHIPLNTNRSVVFVINNEVVPMHAGHVVEINNQRDHYVVNSGSADRIHIIFDYAPASVLAKAS